MWIPIFKTGTWTDSSGQTRKWTEEDLDRIVEKYNSQKEHEAPVVIGHPKDNAPAWGWVERLKREGNILYAKLKDVADEFKEWVKKGLYKKRSISLYPDLTLRHVGFLGAMPPAVKGLPDVSFKEGEARTIEFDDQSFSEGGVRLNQKGYRHARKLILEGKVDTKSSWSFSADDGNKILGDPPDWDEYSKWFLAVDESENKETKAYYKYPFGKNGKLYRSALIAIRQRSAQQGAEDIFDAAGRLIELLDKEVKEMEELEKLKEENERLKKEKMRYEMELKKKEIENFVERLEAENKIPPVFREMGIVEFMVALSGDERTIEFSEGKKKDLFTWFKEFLEKMGEVVPLGAQFKEGKSHEESDYKLGERIAQKVNR